MSDSSLFATLNLELALVSIRWFRYDPSGLLNPSRWFEAPFDKLNNEVTSLNPVTLF
jgi:hypothetical protein